MPQKLETVLKHVDEVSNQVNRQLIHEYHKYLVSRDTSILSERQFQIDSLFPSSSVGKEFSAICVSCISSSAK